jgi:hypothetical protein
MAPRHAPPIYQKKIEQENLMLQNEVTKENLEAKAAIAKPQLERREARIILTADIGDKVDIEQLDKKNKLPVKEKGIDERYFSFLSQQVGFKHVREDLRLFDNPEEELSKIIRQNPDIELIKGFSASALPKGFYTDFRGGIFYGRLIPNYKFYTLDSQGWKIHISAKPESALKILAIVMSIIDFFKDRYGYTYFKVIGSLPSMRTCYYIIGNLVGDARETQVGKFITIYPASKMHAIALIEAIDNALYNMLLVEYIKPDDFYPLKYDALVGKSGGVYVRYGNINHPNDNMRATIYIPPQDQSLSILGKRHLRRRSKGSDSITSRPSRIAMTLEYVLDNRYFPWPDNMNKADASWKNSRDPFPGLNMRWIYERPKNAITWQNRPNYWSDLKINHN